MFKSITHDNDAQKVKPLEPYILGIKYSGNSDIEQSPGVQGESIDVGKENDGDKPAFDMPPFANGRDMRPGH